MAVVLSVQKWRHYLLGRKFTITSDQESSQILVRTKGGSTSISEIVNKTLGL